MRPVIKLCVLFLFLASCEPGDSLKQQHTMNPLLQTFNTPYGVPPFDKIHNGHFEPALKEGIVKLETEIEAIASQDDPATFENTILALENAGSVLTRVSRVFYNLNSAHTNDSIQAIAREMAPEISKSSDNIYLNETLFNRVKQVWEDRGNLDLNTEEEKLLENTYKSFVRSGAELSDQEKERLREINGRLSVLTLNFGQNVLAETNAFQLVVENEADLTGLPDELVKSAAQEAKDNEMEGKWVFTLQNPSVMPFLQYAENRDLRKQIWHAYQVRGNQGNDYDNNEIIKEIVNLRKEKAKLLGYDNHSAFVLEETMAKDPNTVYTFLNQLWTPALAKAKVELEDIKDLAAKDGVDPAPYDWRFYAEKIRKARFDLDEQELKPYFSLEKVKEGVFDVTRQLFGLTFEEITDIPKYHPEVQVYRVMEENGEFLGILYMDFHPRTSKRGGAWMTSYRVQGRENGERTAPVISIVCNFSKPSGNNPALLTFDEVTTFFHEFGHALHGLLSDVQFKSLAGTSVPRDFVELPSQVMENWAEEPELMQSYAVHFETGAPIPEELIEKITRSGTFNQGFATVEYLAASFLDMDFHTLESDMDKEVGEFEKRSMENIGLIDEIIPRYRSTYFNHVFSGGYSSGYYSYIWSGVLDTDAYQAFRESGDLFNPQLATSFREHILSKGGTGDPMEMYVQFRGREPKIDALLKKRGLDEIQLEPK